MQQQREALIQGINAGVKLDSSGATTPVPAADRAEETAIAAVGGMKELMKIGLGEEKCKEAEEMAGPDWIQHIAKAEDRPDEDPGIWLFNPSPESDNKSFNDIIREAAPDEHIPPPQHDDSFVMPRERAV